MHQEEYLRILLSVLVLRLSELWSFPVSGRPVFGLCRVRDERIDVGRWVGLLGEVPAVGFVPDCDGL